MRTTPKRDTKKDRAAIDRECAERGMFVVEAAMTLLLFLITIFGVMEAGRVMWFQQSLTNAAQEGARFAVSPAAGTSNLPSIAQITTHTESFLALVNAPSVNVQRPLLIAVGPVPAQFTRVTVTTNYQVMTIPFFSGLEIPLTGQAQMRNETSP